MLCILDIIIKITSNLLTYIEDLTFAVSKVAGILYSLGNYLPDKSLKLLYNYNTRLTRYNIIYKKVLVSATRCINGLFFIYHLVTMNTLAIYYYTASLYRAYHRFYILNIAILFKFKIL